MPYEYAQHRPFVFTDDGQITFLKVRDTAKKLCAVSGAVRCDHLIRDVSGDSWNILACVDRLVEIGELVEVPNPVSSMGQHRVFIEALGK